MCYPSGCLGNEVINMVFACLNLDTDWPVADVNRKYENWNSALTKVYFIRIKVITGLKVIENKHKLGMSL